MDTISQSQNPNPYNPNFDHPQSYNTDRFNHSLYFRIANYLMSDEDYDDSKNKKLSKNKDVSENTIIDSTHGSSNSFTCTKKCGRGGLKKYKTQEVSRFAFRTKTALEFMDDGYKWRKYGKKMIKNSSNPRNYFKCSSGGCNVKKRVERDSEDPSYVITTYQGIHTHLPISLYVSSSIICSQPNSA